MNTCLLIATFTLITTAAFAADLPAIPSESIAKKKELLFSDDFEAAEPAKVWHKVVPTFSVEKGALKGTQTRDKNIPIKRRNAPSSSLAAPSPILPSSKLENGMPSSWKPSATPCASP